MGKLLRVLVVLLLLLSIAALVFGMKLFGQREMLKGRTQQLEGAIVALAGAVESEVPPLAVKPELVAKDISPVEAERLDTPELSDFWDDYDAGLESRDEDIARVKIDRTDLMSYYKINPATGKVIKDPDQGPMKEVLDDLIAKAGDQYSALAETRGVLKSLREETVATIEELNKQKADLRDARVEISEFAAKLKATVDPLKEEISELRGNVQELTEERDALNIRVGEMQTQIDLAAEEKGELEKKIELLKKDLQQGRRTPGSDEQETTQLEPGVKGTVLAVNPEWNFVVLDLAQETLVELLGEQMARSLPTVDLVVKRAGEDGAFVAKVRLLKVKKAERIGIAEILPKWQQLPLAEGDVVAF